MICIEYKKKSLRMINKDDILATEITYEVDKEDVDMLANSQTEEYKIQRICLYRDNINDLVVDNIHTGRILIAGMRDNKYYITNYIVQYGKEKLLSIIAGIE